MIPYLITYSIFVVIASICIIVFNLESIKLIVKLIPISILISLLISCLPFLLYYFNIGDLMLNYLIQSAYSILLGILFIILSKKVLVKLPNKPIETFFSLVFLYSSLTALSSLILLNFISRNSMSGLLSLSSFFFILPPLIVYSFGLYLQIPKLIYEQWFLPDYDIEPDYDSMDLTKINVVDLEFQKHNNDSTYTKFTVKAPHQITFGQWFFGFVKDYNTKFIESPIQTQNSSKQASSWLFYIKPNFWGDKKYIDPTKTIAENKIIDKTWIIAKRTN